MRLRSIELHGYKSFASRTALQFDAPVTAIVGPNGSGKSNVMDALRWAIGAGSGRSIRTKRNEDVVFSGGRDRAPAGFAEVRVSLDNSDQWLELDAAELEIVRRVHRDGQSEMRVNGRSARLRDVQDLFRSSGLGAGGFALMSQGLVDEILRLRPHERRQAIEEVAGVRQHRHEMNESRRRRERAQEHLERARLLRDELAPRLRSLERSARRARRRTDLQRRLDEALIVYFRAAASEIEAELVRLGEAARLASEARAAAEGRREQATAALASVERETSIARRTVESAAETIRTARSELRALEHQQELDQQQRTWLSREVEELSSRLSADRQDAPSLDLEAARRQLSAVNRRLEAARAERRNQERTHAKATAQHERALADIESIHTQTSAVIRKWQTNYAYLHLSAQDEHDLQRALEESQLERDRLEASLRDSEHQLAVAREASQNREVQRSKLEKRLKQVQRQIRTIEETDEQSDTLQALIRARITDGNRADAIFGELMDAALYDDLDQAVARIGLVIEADIGRATGVLRDRAHELIESILSEVDFAESIDEARDRAQHGRAAVTPEGLMIRPDGVVLAGGSQPGVRRQRAQLEALHAEQDDLLSQLQATEANAQAQEDALTAHTQATSDARERLKLQRRVVEEARKANSEAQRARSTAANQRRSQRDEINRLRSQLERARNDELRAQQMLSTAPPPNADDISHLEAERDRLAANLAEARAQSAAQERARADRARLYSLKRELETVEQALEERTSRLQAASETASDTRTHDIAKEHLNVLEQRRSEAARDLERTQQARVAAERQDVEAAANLREVQSARTRLSTEAAAEGISLESIEHNVPTSQPVMELNGSSGSTPLVNGGNGVSGAATSVEPSPTPSVAVAVETRPSSELKETVDDLRAKLQRLGSVDPAAASEFAAEQQRWRNVEEQIADLEATEAALRNAERDLETLIEQKFREACQQVNQAFGHYFQTMFRGGNAALVLTEDQPSAEDDPESTEDSTVDRPKLGVDIRAQPPGKRVSALSLLSGGERALTAIALLFALLEVRPAPFCVLDEVDAALDEANVERFVAALRERSRETQFVVITHNRRTIEQADSIYGVTMGAAGVSRLLSVRVDQLPHVDTSPTPNTDHELKAETVVR